VGKEYFVWKLGKVFYGLKQSGHLWYQKLKGILELIGFYAFKFDPCVFIWSSSTVTEIQSILGIEVIHDQQPHTISLSHHHYIDKIIAHFGQTNAKDVH